MGNQILKRSLFIILLMGKGATQGGTSMAQTGVDIPKSKQVAPFWPVDTIPAVPAEIPESIPAVASAAPVGGAMNTDRLLRVIKPGSAEEDQIMVDNGFYYRGSGILPPLSAEAKERVRKNSEDPNFIPKGVKFGTSDIQASNDKVRADGTMKGNGFLGDLPAAGGKVSTEVSVGVNIDGKETEIPTLVPTLTQDEIKFITNGGDPRQNKEIMRKALDHAKGRRGEGKNPFADDSESPSMKRMPKLPSPDSGIPAVQSSAPVSQSNWNQTVYQGDRLTARPSKYNIAAKNTPYVGTAQTPDGKQVPISTIAMASPDGKLMVKVDKQGNILAFGDAHDTGSALKSNQSGKARAKSRGGQILPTIDIFQAGRTGLPEDAAALAKANSEESASWRTATPEEIETVKSTLSV